MFSTSKLGHWTPKGGEETIDKLINIKKLGNQNDNAIHVKENEEESLMIMI